ncbi:MAG: AzlD domain-containing protein [Candidatus Nanopelagicales bacterium]
MTAWVVVLAVGAVSLAIRALPMLASDSLRPGDRTREGLRHAGIGAMAALTVTAILPHGSDSGLPDVALLAALGIGAALAWRRVPMVLVVAAGAAVYVALTAVGMGA